MVEQYQAGLSLRQIAELTDRSFSAVRRILDRGVRRRHRTGTEMDRSSSVAVRLRERTGAGIGSPEVAATQCELAGEVFLEVVPG